MPRCGITSGGLRRNPAGPGERPSSKTIDPTVAAAAGGCGPALPQAGRPGQRAEATATARWLGTGPGRPVTVGQGRY